MKRTIIFLGLAIVMFSQCDNGMNAGAPKSKVVTVDSKKKKTAKNSDKQTSSSMADEQVKKAKEILSSVSKKEVEAINAKGVFKTNCASCHGFTGNLGINGAKDLTVSTISLTEAIAQVYHGKGLMTPYKDVLTEVELVAVARYTETLRKKRKRKKK